MLTFYWGDQTPLRDELSGYLTFEPKEPNCGQPFHLFFSFLFQDTSSDLFQALVLTFSIDLSSEEGGGYIELVPNGRDIEVTGQNLYTYVRKYSHYRMVTCQKKALENLKLGLFDVLPSGSLDALTAEDFRLLLNGVSSGITRLQKFLFYFLSFSPVFLIPSPS